MLIEVERNLKPNAEQMKKLLDGAEKISEGTDVDVYYDFSDYRLHGKKIHLRARNGIYEMKMRLKHTKDQLVNVHQEYDMLNRQDEAVFKETLNLHGDTPLDVLIENAIKTGVLIEFNKLTSHKVKYKKECVTIVVNKTDTGYELTEVEQMVLSELDIDESEERIKKLAIDSDMGKEFEEKMIMGKFKENLSIKNPMLYAKLYPSKENNELKLTRFEQLWGKRK